MAASKLSAPRDVVAKSSGFDVILMAMPPPCSGAANRFYTEEFFASCAAVLGNDGIFAFALPSLENLWLPALQMRVAAIYNSLSRHFADIVVLPGRENIIIASKKKLQRDVAVFADVFRGRQIKTELMSAELIQYLYTNDRYAEIAAIISNSTKIINTDDRPICYPATMHLWLSMFFPRLAFVDLEGWLVSASQLPLLPISLAVFFILGLAIRLLRGRANVPLIFAASLTGMFLEMLLLIHYQIKRGTIFEDLGMTMTAFMRGLALGAFAVDRMTRHSAMENYTRRLGLWFVLALLLNCLFALAVFRGMLTNNLFFISLALFFFCGLLVAGIFAFCFVTAGDDLSSARRIC